MGRLNVSDPFQTLATHAAALANALDNPFRAMAQAANLAASAVSAISPALAPVAPAVTAVTTSFNTFLQSAESWTQALSPATVFSFNYALKNLEATLGQAVVPMFQVLIGVVDRFAGILSPIAQSLAPIFHQLADVLGGIFLNVVRALADTFAGFLPVIEAVAGLFEAVAGALAPFVTGVIGALASTVIPIFTALADVVALISVPFRILYEIVAVVGAALQTIGQIVALAFLPLTIVVNALNEALTSFHDITRAIQIVFRVLYDTVASVVRQFFKSNLDLSGIVDYLKHAFQTAAKEILLFSARLALTFGSTDYVKNLIKALGPEGKEQSAVVAAPTNVHITDFTSVANDLATAAFAAGPGGEDKTERQYLQEIVPILEKMLENPQSIKEAMENGIQRIINAILGNTFDGKKAGNRVFKPIT